MTQSNNLKPASPTGGFLRLRAGRIEYTRVPGLSSAGSGKPHPTLVLLHEGLGCCAMWRGFPSALAAATGLDALAYSRPGYGASDRASQVASPRYMHDEALNILAQVLDAAQIKEHILIGHSDGASIAIIYAGGTEARGLRGLVLIAPHVFVEPLTLRAISSARQAFEHGELAARLTRWHGHNAAFAFHRWNDSWLDPEFVTWNIQEFLPRIKVPTLIVQGEHDEYATVAQVAAIERQIGGPTRSVLISQCGHSPHRDAPQATLDQIVSFVKTLNSAPNPA